MAAIMEETHAQICFAETGAEAIAALESAGWDAVLLDLQLPDMTGAEVARLITPRWPGIPIIAVTAQAGSAARETCEAAGMCSVVLKPVEPDQLFAVIRTHVRPPAARPSLDEFAAIFGHQPEKYRAVLESLASEFTSHAASLRIALRDADVPAIHALRHRMHTALVQMKLHSLTKELESLTGSGDLNRDDALHQRCFSAIQSVSTFLTRSAGVMSGPPAADQHAGDGMI